MRDEAHGQDARATQGRDALATGLGGMLHGKDARAVAGRVVEWGRWRLDFGGGCLVMGVLNVTPDSFSDGGRFLDVARAVEHGVAMAAARAAIIDVGGESTRPGAEAVATDEQIRRVVPVIERLAGCVAGPADPGWRPFAQRRAGAIRPLPAAKAATPTGRVAVPISVDTADPAVARAALDAGAAMINDITALADGEMAALAAERGVPVVLMHIQGTPRTMQQAPRYDDVVGEVLGYLLGRARYAEAAGIPKKHIFIDPGIGFGKTADHNLQLLRHIDRFVDSGYRVLVGPSRKAFIGTITGRREPAERVFGTAAVVAYCVEAGVSIVRVHDVAEMVDVVKVSRAIGRA